LRSAASAQSSGLPWLFALPSISIASSSGTVR
jgi:hypothetical protein